MSGVKRKTRRGGASTSGTKAPATRQRPRPTDDEDDVYSNLFATKEAATHFESFCRKRDCIRERGLVIGPGYLRQFGAIEDNIRQRHWEPFCEPMRTCGVTSIVREFYANVPASRLDKVYVRGTWVDFHARAINAVLGLPDIDPDEEDYRQFLLSQIDYEAVKN